MEFVKLSDDEALSIDGGDIKKAVVVAVGVVLFILAAIANS